MYAHFRLGGWGCGVGPGFEAKPYSESYRLVTTSVAMKSRRSVLKQAKSVSLLSFAPRVNGANSADVVPAYMRAE